MAQKLLRTSLDYTNKFPGSDVVIIIQGQKIHAVSAVLSIASPNFTDLLRRHGKTIDFSDVGAAIDYDAFCELMAMSSTRPPPLGKVNWLVQLWF